MAKPRSNRVPAGQHEALRQAADLILKRALEVKVPASKDRALDLARLVLGSDPEFGGREMRDQQIAQVLESEDIGIATFRKALTAARKELVKKPAGTSKPKNVQRQGDAPSGAKPKAHKPHPENGAIAANVDRRLL